MANSQPIATVSKARGLRLKFRASSRAAALPASASCGSLGSTVRARFISGANTVQASAALRATTITSRAMGSSSRPSTSCRLNSRQTAAPFQRVKSSKRGAVPPRAIHEPRIRPTPPHRFTNVATRAPSRGITLANWASSVLSSTKPTKAQGARRKARQPSWIAVPTESSALLVIDPGQSSGQ